MMGVLKLMVDGMKFGGGCTYGWMGSYLFAHPLFARRFPLVVLSISISSSGSGSAAFAVSEVSPEDGRLCGFGR